MYFFFVLGLNKGWFGRLFSGLRSGWSECDYMVLLIVYWSCKGLIFIIRWGKNVYLLGVE